MQTRTTNNPQTVHHKVWDLRAEYWRPHDVIITGYGKYGIKALFDTGIKPYRADKNNWMCPVLTSMRLTFDEKPAYRTLAGVISNGYWERRTTLQYGTDGLKWEYHPDPIDTTEQYDFQDSIWERINRVDWVDTIPSVGDPPSDFQEDLHDQSEYTNEAFADYLLVNNLFIQTTWSQYVAPIGIDPNPPLGFQAPNDARLSAYFSVYWVPVSNMELFRRRRSANLIKAN